ncbi:MAG TPA: AAA family ATPase [Acidimicrobiales bacterium]|nr:AAA family ATPase [Acidimicrobiales bacterium]
MKLGVVGKGGTGKTTISTLVGLAYRERGRRVLAIDTDSNPNLALGLGLGEDAIDRAPLVPRALVVGTGRGNTTPATLIADFGVPTPAGITLLHAMRVDSAASGCTCSSHTSVRSVLGAALEDECDVALVDMEAGLEHLARSGGTLAHADVLLMVMEPTRRSVLTAARTIPLAQELGIPRVAGVGNKARPEDVEFFEAVCAGYGVPLAGVIPFDPAIVAADRFGSAVQLPVGPGRDALEALVDYVESPDAQRAALLAEKERIERRLADLATTT